MFELSSLFEYFGNLCVSYSDYVSENFIRGNIGKLVFFGTSSKHQINYIQEKSVHL